jgi:hypothetical protein
VSGEGARRRAELARRREDLFERTVEIGAELPALERALGRRWGSALAWGVNIGSTVTAAFGFAGGVTLLGLVGAGLAIASWLTLGIDRTNKGPLYERIWLLNDELRTIRRELSRIDAELADLRP